MTQDELSMQQMNKDTMQLFEHRKFVWDNKAKKYKKLKVNMQGKVIKEDADKLVINDQIKNRFANWTKSTKMFFQKEGDQEIESQAKRAKSLLVKRTLNKQTKNSIMARTDGVFVNKTKRQHRDGTQRGEDSGGRGRGKYQKLERQIEKKTAKNQQRFGSQGNSN